MKNRPIHQNLDTSFVNLSALIKYLRRRQFEGSVKIQLNGYYADIHFQADHQMKVSEHDQISGRVSTGEEALQRLLIRAREPGGTINVYQLVEKPIEKDIKQKVNTNTQTIIEDELIIEAKVVEPIQENVKEPVYQNGFSQNGFLKTQTTKKEITQQKASEQDLKKKNIQELKKKATEPVKKEKSLPDFPFTLKNKVEDKAKQKEITEQDWQTLLKLTVEILVVIDKSLAPENLDFAAAFRKARMEIGEDYPFLSPISNIFDYEKGKIKMTKKVNPKIFVVGIIEALRRILEKLETNQNFSNLHRSTVQTLIALMHKRQPHYDRFSITSQLKRILGI